MAVTAPTLLQPEKTVDKFGKKHFLKILFN
jgi:hypothetical protein